jgi:hypothetical protein
VKFAEPGGGEADYTFHRGPVMVECRCGAAPFHLRFATRRERATMWLRDRWMSATRWFRPRTVTSDVDVEAGCIMLATERWSWLRWRWVQS